MAEADARVAELRASLRNGSVDDGMQRGEVHVDVDVRFRGQEHSLSVPLPPAGNSSARARVDALTASFKEKYRDVFLHDLDHELELVTLRVSTRTPSGLGDWPARVRGTRARGGRTVQAYSFSLERTVDFAVVERDSVRVGDDLPGPAIIVEPTTTTYLDAGFAAHDHESGCLLVSRVEAGVQA
jgi:N-methylhydantoinase A